MLIILITFSNWQTAPCLVTRILLGRVPSDIGRVPKLFLQTKQLSSALHDVRRKSSFLCSSERTLIKKSGRKGERESHFFIPFFLFSNRRFRVSCQAAAFHMKSKVKKRKPKKRRRRQRKKRRKLKWKEKGRNELSKRPICNRADNTSLLFLFLALF